MFALLLLSYSCIKGEEISSSFILSGYFSSAPTANPRLQLFTKSTLMPPIWNPWTFEPVMGPYSLIFHNLTLVFGNTIIIWGKGGKVVRKRTYEKSRKCFGPLQHQKGKDEN